MAGELLGRESGSLSGRSARSAVRPESEAPRIME